MAGEADPPAQGTGRASVGVHVLAIARHYPVLEWLLAIVGIAAFLLGTLPELAPRDRLLTLTCLVVAILFAAQYAVRLWRAPLVANELGAEAAAPESGVPPRSAAPRLRWAMSGAAVVDLLSAA